MVVLAGKESTGGLNALLPHTFVLVLVQAVEGLAGCRLTHLCWCLCRLCSRVREGLAACRLTQHQPQLMAQASLCTVAAPLGKTTAASAPQCGLSTLQTAGGPSCSTSTELKALPLLLGSSMQPWMHGRRQQPRQTPPQL